MNAREAARFILQLPQPFKVLDPLGERFNVAEHHGRRTDAAELVPDATNFQPIVGHHLAAGHGGPHAIDQNLATPAGQTAEARRFKPLQHRAERHFVHFGEVINLRRAEAVDVNLRVLGFDATEQFFVPLEFELGMQPALQQDLVATEGDGLFDLLENLFERKDVSFRRFWFAIERAEIAHRGADVGVVDVAIDVVRAVRLRMESARHLIGRAAERGEIVRLQQRKAFGGGEPLARDRFVKQSRDGGVGVHSARWGPTAAAKCPTSGSGFETR